VKPKFMV